MSKSADFDISGGLASLVAVAGFANVFTIAPSGPTNLTISDTSGTILNGSGAISGGWSGSGTGTITGSRASITSGLSVNVGDGSNTVNLQGVGGVNSIVLLATSTGSIALNVSSDAPTNTGDLADATATLMFAGAGQVFDVVISGVGAVSGYSSVIVSASNVQGMLGAAQDQGFIYSGLNTLTLKFPDDSTVSVSGTSCSLTIVNGGATGTYKFYAISNATTFTGGTGSDIVKVGDAAGGTIGLDGIDAALSIAAAAGSNSIEIDDTLSSTGGKTYTITPGGTQATYSTLASSSFTTISYKATGGSFATLLKFRGAAIGGNTFVIAAPFLDNAIIVGGGADNIFDFAALTGVDVPNGDGTGVFTQANGKTISYSGVAPPEPTTMLEGEPLYIGRIQQGCELPLPLQCTNASGTPQDPTAIPHVTIYRDAGALGRVETRPLAADLRGVQVGLFRYSLFLGTLYTAGRYIAVFKWCDQDGIPHHKDAYFHVLPGGSADGAVLSMHYLRRPDAAWLLTQHDSGRLIRKRNPR